MHCLHFHSLILLGISATKALPTQSDNVTNSSVTPFSIAEPGSVVSELRRAQVKVVRTQFLYGPDIVPTEDGAFYPSGVLGDAVSAVDTTELISTLEPWQLACEATGKKAAQSVEANGGIQKLSDYGKFYEYHVWNDQLGLKPFAGMVENGTSDLLFSMERLSVQPYSLRRLRGNIGDELPFEIDDEEARNVTNGKTLQEIFEAGRLFYVDYSELADIPLTQGRFAAGCDAYFFQDATNDDAFLPLAIRAKTQERTLTYTPLDSALDWQLAKMLFAQNDVFWVAFHHLAAVHLVTDIVYMSAVRSLNDQHPVHGILSRLARQTFGIRYTFANLLTEEGGPIDQSFSWSGAQGRLYGGELYREGAGNFISNYFEVDLERRGLLNSHEGPALRKFPFYEDASSINRALADFMKAYVSSYYPSDQDILQDAELQAWAAEANGDARVMDFPSEITSRQDLVDILTHAAHLVSVKHGVANMNELFAADVTPFHPAAFYAPLPTAKGQIATEEDLLKLLPDVNATAVLLTLTAVFSLTAKQGETVNLANMFCGDPVFLAKTNAVVRAAAAVFRSRMEVFGAEVQGRTFDENGLSQGMPFVWTVLDPITTPFYAAI